MVLTYSDSNSRSLCHNILQIVSHDTGDPRQYLNQEQLEQFMPNFSKFLKEHAVCFTNAHTPTPECSAARGSIATGQEPHEPGCEMYGLAHPPYLNTLANTNHHIARYLKDALKKKGIEIDSVHIGVEHVTNNTHEPLGKSSIFDSHIRTEDNYARHILPPALDVINSWKKDKNSNCHYLQIDLEETHREKKYAHFREHLEIKEEELPPLPRGLPDTSEVRQDWACFLGELRKLDKAYGEIFEALEKNDLLKDTLVIATTDHGIPYPGYKCNVNRKGTGVYFAVAGPGFSEHAGEKCDALVSHIDIVPTLCRAIGIDPPGWAKGEALQQLVNGHSCIHEATFHELTRHVAEDNFRAVRTAEWLFIERVGPSMRPPCNIDNSPAKEEVLKKPELIKKHLIVPQYQLYRTGDEETNLAYDPAYRDTVDKMKVLLREHMEQTHDPLIRGSVPLREGGIVFGHYTLSTPRAEADLEAQKGNGVFKSSGVEDGVIPPSEGNRWKIPKTISLHHIVDYSLNLDSRDEPAPPSKILSAVRAR